MWSARVNYRLTAKEQGTNQMLTCGIVVLLRKQGRIVLSWMQQLAIISFPVLACFHGMHVYVRTCINVLIPVVAHHLCFGCHDEQIIKVLIIYLFFTRPFWGISCTCFVGIFICSNKYTCFCTLSWKDLLNVIEIKNYIVCSSCIHIHMYMYMYTMCSFCKSGCLYFTHSQCNTAVCTFSLRFHFF